MYKSLLDGLNTEIKTKILMTLPELIVTSLESNERNIPSLEEIDHNLDINIEGFINYVSHVLPIIKSIAPVVGITFDDALTYGNLRLKNPTLADLQDISTIKYHTTKDLYYYDHFYRAESPILVLEHEFNWNPNPNDYSVEKNIQLVHTLCITEFTSVLSSIRLSIAKPDKSRNRNNIS